MNTGQEYLSFLQNHLQHLLDIPVNVLQNMYNSYNMTLYTTVYK